MTTTAFLPDQSPEKIHSSTGWREYFSFSTDHKVIGIQYLVLTFIFYLIGGALATAVRLELATPTVDVVSRDLYNQLFTVHATVMIFLWIVPAGSGAFGNYLIPLLIGARDMAFPKLNAVAFWLLPPAGILLIASFLVEAPSSGWTSYPPLSLMSGKTGEMIWILSVLLLGTSSILGAINFATTIIKMRRPGLGWNQMPLFCWAMLSTSIMAILSTPVLAGALILLSFDLMVGTNFFNPLGGGNPVVYQHLFWFYSHPAVYIMILPVFGMISEILPVHARKPIFGYQAIAYSSLAITFLSLIVWAHHMFTSGTPPWLRMFFMIATMIIAVPTGIKVFSWLATLWGGKLQLTSALLFSVGFISMFVIGGLSGIMLASVPVDIHVHDTYFVVAHFHYVLFGGSVFGLYAGIYHWFPKMTGRLLNEGWGKVHFILTLVGFNLCFLPMHWLGLQGMPRRVAEYDPQFATVNLICSIGSFILAISTIPFLINAVWSWIAGAKAGPNPWGGITPEWLTSSPPPVENWVGEAPLVTNPYGYGDRKIIQP
ncbi:cytochrome c oxidase subunit I [Synechococcus elongatus]|uniref:Cytochrome c oxidase subunit 1 n=2 Tax=Synechococcus elongatus TaxID=32046 RepID=Q31JY6_SYNE7|nr:cytochrome c oxidase subunit I [Synechococcus elongatus]ABB58633.1 Cytochrome-c oxidase [Synechococcus elongatus PCC 7942 = FACHB-805]AJD56914.1 cytochrome C oxidase subunit I [Synechococcus elongatus UTEX 2973]MBD2587854.1 cytochrome c oxidase subunit I [Synechococcus elongatus FACHB-242]MBD2688922.1 cytochrome c oxidase subunit I [Synechococcus elongatus FACHB-1061]MBD2707438.1 cytochrome c oxidase subunit I [Synechococcus elongatus PCC 7942 = FACHB-805]